MSVDTGSSDVTERAYQSLSQGAVLADRSDRLRILFTGDKAAESLTGLVTNDVLALRPGLGQYAAALTAKGKIIADIRIFARDDGFLVDAGALAGPHWSAMIRKFVNPRLAKYQDVSAQTGDIGIFGSGALEITRSVLNAGEIPSGMTPFSHTNVNAADATLMVARVPDFGVEGYDLIGPRDAIHELRTRFIAAGAIEDPGEALQVARIEAGRPAWGIDMDDTMLAQEMDLERLDAISFTKGCYTGQETVARVHYRGHVNRLLRGLRFPSATVPPLGTALVDETGKEVGTVKSGVISPRRGAIALALLRREVEPGAQLTASWSSESLPAVVQSLPFDG